MLKLLLCLIAVVSMAIGVMQLRQQKRELAYQCGKLAGKIESVQIDLWNQQLQIATATAPDQIDKTVGDYDLSLVPSNPKLVPGEVHPDAE